MAENKKLYGLFIGINEYAAVSSLNGCVNDVNAIKSWLENQPDFTLVSRVHTSDDEIKPTKSVIVNAIREHLGQAGKDDYVLFYFAGHGVQEKTDIPAFVQAETRGLMEALVCYDSNLRNAGSQDQTCLSDKELRWLFYHISQNHPHILIITDCCHSGDVMRESLDDNSAKKRMGSEKALKPRAWEGFIFNEDISPDELNHKPLSDVIPLGDYIHFAACRDTEVAWEGTYDYGKPGGLFTISLLKILNKGGRNLSYRDLNSRLVNYMRNWKTKIQRPQVFASSDSIKGLYSSFLSGEMTQTPVMANIIGNPRLGWTLDLGAIHGIHPEDKNIPVKVYINPTEPPIGEVFIDKIYPGFCTLTNPGNLLVREQQFYYAKVNCFAANPPAVYLKGEDTDGLEMFKNLLKENPWEEKSLSINLVETEDEADYVLIAENGTYSIAKSHDTRPLVQQVYGYNTASAKLVRDYFLHIARWKFVRELNNPHTKLTKGRKNYPVEIQVWVQGDDGTDYELNLREVNKLEMNGSNEAGKPSGKIKIKLTNVSSQELYCSLLYLPMTFGVYNTLLPNGGVWLNPDDEIWAVEGEYIELQLEDYIYDFRWEGAFEFIKLIVSTTDFGTEELTLQELPVPEIKRSPLSRSSFRIYAPGNEVKEDDWMAAGYEIFIKNPELFA